MYIPTLVMFKNNLLAGYIHLTTLLVKKLAQGQMGGGGGGGGGGRGRESGLILWRGF